MSFNFSGHGESSKSLPFLTHSISGVFGFHFGSFNRNAGSLVARYFNGRPIGPADIVDAALEQHGQFKNRYPDHILLFRMGDYYEVFYEDAELVCKSLGLALTRRNRHSMAPIPMAAIPVHCVESYLRRMIALGHRAAICEQQE